MHDEIIRKLLECIDENSILKEAYPKFSGEGYRTHKIDAKNFHDIKKLNSDKKIAFVDGGNAEIINSANFSLNLIRICYVIFQGNRKIRTKKFEFLAFIQAVNENNEIFFKTTFFNIEGSFGMEEISFSSFDHTLMLGVNRAEISSVANVIRRFAELKLAKFVVDERSSNAVVLDGNLQCALTNENKYLNELYESCDKNNVILSALSKTSSVFTTSGNLLSVVLNSIGNLSPWFYHPIAEISNSNHKAEMFFVKFHSKSKHVFRFEIFNAQKLAAENIINELSDNCIDPIFIGYPYGLVEADRIARISNQEKESLKTMFLVKLRNKNIEKYLSSVNAHEILDKISF